MHRVHCRVWRVYRVFGLGLMIAVGFRVEKACVLAVARSPDAGRVWGVGSPGFRVSGFGFRVSGLGSRV